MPFALSRFFSRLPGLALLAASAALIAAVACSSGPEVRQVRLPAATPSGTLTPLSGASASESFYTDSAGRAALSTIAADPPRPTRGPVPTLVATFPDGTPLPTGYSLLPTPVVEVTPTLPAPVPTGPPAVASRPPFSFESFLAGYVLETPGCVEDFRTALFNHPNPAAFSADLLTVLSGEFAERRPDCVQAGWAPEFSLDPVCVRMSHALVSGTFTRILPNGTYRLLATQRESAGGSMLVHFARLPFTDSPGCWYYRDVNRGWYWLDWGNGESGMVPHRPKVCEELVKALVAYDLEGGVSADVTLVNDAVERARLLHPRSCAPVAGRSGGYLWSLAPQSEAAPGCSVSAPTGSLEDGGFVVHWQPEFTDSMSSACWRFHPDTGWAHDGPETLPRDGS